MNDIMTEYLSSYQMKPSVKQNTVHAIESAIVRLKAEWGGLSVRAIGSKVVSDIWDEIANRQGHT